MKVAAAIAVSLAFAVWLGWVAFAALLNAALWKLNRAA
jgi:tryptophan-rich sensory protein